MAASTSSSARTSAPTWLSRFLSNFPLYTYPDSASGSSSTSTAPEAPTLYVVPPHPALASSWTSADPRCLRWQMELLFRSPSQDAQPIKVVFLDPRAEDLVWGPGGTLPFLHLPLAPDSRNPAGNLVGVSALQHWVDNYHPYAWERPELGEKVGSSSAPYADEALRLEAQSWITLLETKALAGLVALYRLSLLRRLSYLTPIHPTSHPSPLPAFLAWLGAVEFTHPFSLPGGADAEKDSATIIGKSELEREEEIGDRARAGDWRSCRSEREEARVLELAMKEGSGSYTDLLQGACEAIEAVGVRMEADGEGAEKRWALGADKPAPLDALLFSILHTVLSLPVDHTLQHASPVSGSGDVGEDDDPAYTIKAPARTLREAVERHPVLVRWTRHVWNESVRPSKLFSVQS
ncbi:hypothetical protein OC835_000310 [Tilletia horrida]|nr:hypothetical protein OC835_000310 [Tilletia horrida]